MKTLILSLLTLISFHSSAQSSYEKAMSEALNSWKSGNPKEASAKFERIAQVETTNWLPKYYQALIGITQAFSIQDGDEKMKMIDAANALIPQDEKSLNAEWYNLKAMAQIAELTIDPRTSAMVLSPQIFENYGKALALEPNNPRAIAGLADFQIQSKKYMGGDTKEECKQLEKAVSLFDTEKHDIKFYPSWGKERAVMLLGECKK